MLSSFKVYPWIENCQIFYHVINFNMYRSKKIPNLMKCTVLTSFIFNSNITLDLPRFFLKASYRLDLRDRFGAEPHLPRHLEGLKSGFNWAVRTWIVPSWDILRDNPQWLKQSKFELVFWRQVHSSGSEKVTFEFSTTRVLK